MFVHGDNLKQKETHRSKYCDKESRLFLKEIRKHYNIWQKANMDLIGPKATPSDADNSVLARRVALFSGYKDFIDQQKYAEKFDARSNLHSTVLEEFMFYLFKDLVRDFSRSVLIGKAKTFKDIFFSYRNFSEMVTIPSAQLETKDHDFVIGINIETQMQVLGSENRVDYLLQIPAVAIECKTYLDKTMLEGSSTAAEQLKFRNPNALYIVVAEWLKLTEQINLKKFKVDQIYVLRKQKNTDREFRFLPDYEKNPIFSDVVCHLFNFVRDYLTSDWDTGVQYGLDRGFLI
ncbi:Bpu10I family restriction endonuclease [bacterium]|nr:Bpu10I family restriction endonuclease [bacterium]